MSTHAAGRGHRGTYAVAIRQPRHIRATEAPRWWHTDRGRQFARDLGDFVDELHQLAAVAAAALVLLGAASLMVAALWPVEPHLATAVGASTVLAVVWGLWRMRRRP